MTQSVANPLTQCAIVTNIPTPYRNPVYARLPSDQFQVIFCAQTEGNRQWRLPAPSFRHQFLRDKAPVVRDGYNYVHNNPDVWRALTQAQPSVVVSTGITPTHLYAFAWAKTHGAKHIYMTDGTLESERILGWKHRLVRRVVFAASQAFVVASKGGQDLLASYSVAPSKIFVSRLCADNTRFLNTAALDRDFDVMFAGQLHERKLPMLFAAVCGGLVRRRGSCRALVVGDGPMRQAVLERLTAEGVTVTYPGFVQPDALASWYARSKLLLFTTRLDPWGVVANEAMACGTPVITTPQAGVAGDLVLDGINGAVLPPTPDLWVQACCAMLDDVTLWAQRSAAAQEKVQEYSYDTAAQGLQAAYTYALGAD